MMARRYFSILVPLFVLLWIAGTNHCAFESLFSADVSNAQGDCQSHPENSSDSHKEGQPCVTKLLPATGEQIQAKVISDLSNSLQNFNYIVLLSRLMLSEQYTSAAPPASRGDPHKASYQSLVSLSIASNAPPATA